MSEYMDANNENSKATASDAAERENKGIYTHKLKKPFEYEGKTYEEITFYFERLTGYDMVAIEKEMIERNEYMLAPEASRSFQAKMAAKAAKMGSDVIEAMPVKEFNTIANAARLFLLDTGC